MLDMFSDGFLNKYDSSNFTFTELYIWISFFSQFCYIIEAVVLNTLIKLRNYDKLS